MGKYYVPFAYQKYGRIEIDDPNITTVDAAIEAADEKLQNMSVQDMESLSSYLADSEEIDKNGIVLDENNNTID